MEDMLIIWMQNMIHKKIPICGLAIRQQALEFYKFIKHNLLVLQMKLSLLAGDGSTNSKKDFLLAIWLCNRMKISIKTCQDVESKRILCITLIKQMNKLHCLRCGLK